MVTRLYIKDLVGFSKADLAFEEGLVVFSGPSGAGKSVLLSALLSLFGFESKSYAALGEATVKKPPKFDAEDFVLDDDELVIKQIKKEKLRYFLSDQSVSKKRLKTLFAPYVKYLSARDQSGLESEALLDAVDAVASTDKAFTRLKKEYVKRFATYTEKKRAYEELVQNEAAVAERREFLRFEIDKIAAIDPKEGEEEELLAIKKRLSRLDKIKEVAQRVEGIFALERAVEEFYALTEGDSGLFDEAMNRLRADLEASAAMADELEEIDVESVLDRLGELNGLIKRFGSIREALAYKEEKERELAQTEHIEADKTHLERYLEMERAELETLAGRLSSLRKKTARAMEEEIGGYLAALKLPPLRFVFHRDALGVRGADRIDVDMEGSSVRTLSGGEFNRVRLALTAASAKAHRNGGVIVLDEIDANVSGEESIAIAELIERLSKHYQVFAISHQPHLTAKAAQHVLVEKKEGRSEAVVLDEAGRIDEIARIIGGENPSDEAVEFAKKLRSYER